MTAVAKIEIGNVAGLLEAMKPQLAMALPKHITPDRMVRVALTALQNTPKLLECDRGSFLLAILRAAQLGLEPDGVLGQAYLIPFGGKVQFIPGYKGLIDLARRSGEVSSIIAKEVYSGDEFKVDFSQEIPFTHRPKLEGDRGRITHFWALARFKDGGFHWDYMNVADVEAIRDLSSGYIMAKKFAKNGVINSPWVAHFIEMGKKTVIRRIAKYLPMSVQRAATMVDLTDAGKQFSTNDFGDIVIEGDVVDEMPENTAAPETKSKLDDFAANAASTEEINKQFEDAAAQAEKAQEAIEGDAPVVTLPELTALPEKTLRDLEVKARQAIRLIESGTDDKVSVLGAINSPSLVKRLADGGRGPLADKLLAA